MIIDSSRFTLYNLTNEESTILKKAYNIIIYEEALLASKKYYGDVA